VKGHAFAFFLMHSLHDVYKMKANLAGLSVSMYQPMNHCKNSDEHWYKYYATGGYPKLDLLNFLQSVTPQWTH
jgi:hypothetical protein